MNRKKSIEPAKPLKLGVLDICACYPGLNPPDAISQTIEMAARIEQLGYSRFWLAEHHNRGFAHSCPEIITAVVAGVTNAIRVGSACVLLRHYNPYKVASTFRLLNTLYPDRIDLGVGRGFAVGVTPAVLPQSVDTYPVQIAKLVESARSVTGVQPGNVPPPEIWIHGSAGNSVSLAAEAGTCFSLGLFLDFHRKVDHRAIMECYRTSFKPSAQLAEPRCNLTVAGICAETEQRAWCLLEQHRAVIAVVPTVVGNPQQCRHELERLASDCGVDEIIFLDLCTRFEDRLHSYELLGAEIGLKPPGEDSELGQDVDKLPLAV